MNRDSDRLELILSVANEGFWKWNLTTDQLYLSPQFCELIGYSSDDSIFDSAFLKKIIHPDDHDIFFNAIREPLPNKKNASLFDCRIISKDSSVHWIECRISYVEHDRDGVASSIAGTVVDITRRIKAEEERNRLNRALLAINKCNQALIHADDEMDLLNTLCQIAVETGGYRMAWVGYTVQDEAKSVRPVAQAGYVNDYLEAFEISWDDVECGRGPLGTAIRTGKPCAINDIHNDPRFSIWRDAATLRGYASCLSLPLTAGEGVFGALTIYSAAPDSFNAGETSLFTALADNLAYGITMLRVRKASKVAESQLKKMSAAVHQIPVVVVVTDPSGKIEYVNPAFTKLTGYSAEEASGNNIRILQSGLTPKSIYDDLWQTILSGNVWHGEIQNRKKNGNLYWQSAVISSMIDENGEITDFVAAMEDITEQKLHLDELIAAKEKAEVNDRLKTAFLANISHEIRTPMNGILGFSELLNKPHLSGEEQTEYTGLILQSGQRMLNLINDIIDISRIEAGEKVLQKTEFQVNQILYDLKAFFQHQTDKKGLRLTCMPGLSDGESVIKTDCEKLIQILTNLIENALKFTNKGGIDFGYISKDRTLEFYVIDTGIGIPETMHEAIFDRFHQVDNSFARTFEGSGLGLSITKSYIEMLGGTILVESLEGAGSKFSFTLPYVADSPKTERPFCAAQNPADSTPGLTILIAEDDKVSSLLLTNHLKMAGVALLLACNGWEAVKLVEHHPEIDLVLMDIKMPVMNGFEATRKIKKLRPDLPVIAQTACTSVNEMEAAKEAGCESFITKPIDKNKLLALIKDTLVLMRSDAFMPEAPLQTKAAVSSPDNMTAVWTLVRNEWLLLTPNGNKVKLTSKEFDFISILVSHHKQVVTRQEIIGKAITGTNEESRRGALEALVHRLRHKTRTADNGSPIKTAHGMGYSFSADIRII